MFIPSTAKDCYSTDNPYPINESNSHPCKIDSTLTVLYVGRQHSICWLLNRHVLILIRLVYELTICPHQGEVPRTPGRPLLQSIFRRELWQHKCFRVLTRCGIKWVHWFKVRRTFGRICMALQSPPVSFNFVSESRYSAEQKLTGIAVHR